jgi:pyridoxine 5-phosphate synthase
MTKLSVNLNKFALIRNSRDTDNPNVCGMALRAIQAGVHGITIHPRPDQRHTRYSDVEDLSRLTGSHPDVEFNVEGNPGADFLEIVGRTRPDQCTLVPDAPDQLTSDHGWDLAQDAEKAKPVVKQLQDLGIRVSLFMDPVAEQIDIARSIGADRVELYTEPYARAFGTDAEDEVWGWFETAASHATSIGLGVNAGHDLNLRNLPRFLTIPGILEVSIGHAIVVESFDHGFEDTIRRYLDIVS